MKKFKKTDKTLTEIKKILDSGATIDCDSEDRLDELVCKGIDDGYEGKILDIIENAVDDENHAIAENVFVFNMNNIMSIAQDSRGDLYDISCFAIPFVNVAIKNARWEPYLQTHELKLPPGDALAKTFREPFELDPDTSVVLVNSLVTAEYLSQIDAKGWRDFMRSVIKNLNGETGSISLPKVGKLDKSLQDIDENNILLLNRCMIGAIIYSKDKDGFAALIGSDTDELNRWSVLFKAELMKELEKIAPVDVVSVTPAITPASDAADISVRFTEALDEKMAMTTGKLRKFVFYTYENWHARFKDSLMRKSGGEIAAMYSAFLDRYCKEVDDHLNADKETSAIFLKADTRKMLEYIDSCGLDPEDESSWEDAQSVLMPINKPLIETTMTGANFYAGKSDISISIHTNSDIPYCIIATIVYDKKVVAQKFLWNTGASEMEESMEALMKELKPYGKRIYKIEGAHDILVCDCCHKLTGLFKDGNKIADTGRLIH